MKKAKPYSTLSAISFLTISKHIGIDLYEWTHRYREASKRACEYLASRLDETQSVQLVYGFFCGGFNNKFRAMHGNSPIAYYFLLDSNNVVIDPMRWVFEQIHPYLSVSPLDPLVHDVEGQRTRIMQGDGAPNPDPHTTPIDLSFLPKDLYQLVQAKLYWPSKFDRLNLTWLSSSNALELEPKKDLYTYLMLNGLSDLLNRETMKELGLLDGTIIDSKCDAMVGAT